MTISVESIEEHLSKLHKPDKWYPDSHRHGQKGCMCGSCYVTTGYKVNSAEFPCCDETGHWEDIYDDCIEPVLQYEEAKFMAMSPQYVYFLLQKIKELEG